MVGIANLIERHWHAIRRVLSFFGRVVIQGTLLRLCHPQAMATMLDSHWFQLLDYTHFVEPSL